MPNPIRIKRRAGGGSAGAPASLANAELAYNESDPGNGILYYGFGTGGAGGSATTIVPIGGDGAYTTLGTTQTVTGSKTFSGLVTLSGSGANSPTAVTQAANDNSTRLATTAFVLGQANSTAGAIAVNGTQAAGTSNLYARADHVHPTDTSRAPTASPALTGTPTSTTAAADTNSTQIATTAFVVGQASSSNPAALGSVTIGSSLRYARADHIHAMPTLSQVGAPTADLALGGFKITNLGAPTLDTDAATKGYVDAARSGLDVKQSVRAASTTNLAGITYSATGGTSARGQITTAPNTLDGVTLAANDRILLKNQSTAAQNGIWVVTTVGTGANGVWDRATDFDQDAEVTAGAFTFIEEGTSNGDSGWVLTTNNPITIGGASGTALSFAQFNGAGGGVSTFSAGTTGLTPSTATGGAITLAGVLVGANGGTGVNNGSSTITVGGNLAFSGAFGTTFTVTGTTALTLPTSGVVLSDGSTIDGGTY